MKIYFSYHGEELASGTLIQMAPHEQYTFKFGEPVIRAMVGDDLEVKNDKLWSEFLQRFVIEQQARPNNGGGGYSIRFKFPP